MLRTSFFVPLHLIQIRLSKHPKIFEKIFIFHKNNKTPAEKTAGVSLYPKEKSTFSAHKNQHINVLCKSFFYFTGYPLSSLFMSFWEISPLGQQLFVRCNIIITKSQKIYSGKFHHFTLTAIFVKSFSQRFL